MKPIAIKNEDGEIIEIKWDKDGNIFIRHSDIDRKRFGQLREYSKVSKEPKFKEFLKANGIDADAPMIKDLTPKMGASLVIDDKSHIINTAEVSLILETVKLNGG